MQFAEVEMSVDRVYTQIAVQSCVISLSVAAAADPLCTLYQSVTSGVLLTYLPARRRAGA